MQYHSVLEAVENGTTVILSEHTLTERLFLKTVFFERVVDVFKETDVHVHVLSNDEELIKSY